MLRVESVVSYVPGKRSTSELHSEPLHMLQNSFATFWSWYNIILQHLSPENISRIEPKLSCIAGQPSSTKPDFQPYSLPLLLLPISWDVEGKGASQGKYIHWRLSTWAQDFELWNFLSPLFLLRICTCGVSCLYVQCITSWGSSAVALGIF